MTVGSRRYGAVCAVVLGTLASCWGETVTNGTAVGGNPGVGGSGGSIGATSGVGGTVAAGGNWTDGAEDSPADGAGAMPDGSVDVIDAPLACPWSLCTKRACNGMILQCGDCFENDGDGLLDSEDPDCLGPCDNDEEAWEASYGAIACNADCFFDGDYLSDDDQCFWGHQCDPLAVAPYYDSTSCLYVPDAGVYGTNATCSELMASQSSQCLATCLSLVPNGCDCFGCCIVPGASTPIWLGSSYSPPCTKETAGDPMRCKPCMIVPSCFNPCETCELCLDKTSLPPECDSTQQCPPGAQPCGLADQPCCPPDTYCITGCCQPVPVK